MLTQEQKLVEIEAALLAIAYMVGDPVPANLIDVLYGIVMDILGAPDCDTDRELFKELLGRHTSNASPELVAWFQGMQDQAAAAKPLFDKILIEAVKKEEAPKG